MGVTNAHRYADIRVLLFAAAFVLFARTQVHFRIRHEWRRMPLLLGLFLIALFVWLAENVGTWTHTWLYPHQGAAWSPVRIEKSGSWFLLLVVSTRWSRC